MSAVKTAVAGVLAVAGLVAIGWAVLQAPAARAAAERGPLKPLELRPLPGAPTARAPLPPSAEDDPEPLRPLPAADAGAPAAAASDAGAPVAAAGPAPRPGGPAPGPGGRPPPPAAGEGTLSLTASDTADIYLDGRKVGSSPMRGLKVRAGPHKVRFDCYDAAGNAVTGTVKVVTVVADQEQALTYPCPESQ